MVFQVIQFKTFHFSLTGRRSLENLVPIVKKDKDIENLLQLSNSEITKVVDIFLKSGSKIHVFRAIEPNLRLGGAFTNYLVTKNRVDKCIDDSTDTTINQCLRFGSKKQISESIALFEDEQLEN